MPISLTVRDTPVSDVLALVSAEAGLPVVVSTKEAAAAPVTLDLRRGTVAQAIEAIAAQIGCAVSYVPREGVVRLVPDAEAVRPFLVDGLWSDPAAWVKIIEGAGDKIRAVPAAGGAVVYASRDVSDVVGVLAGKMRPGMWELSVWVMSLSRSGQFGALLGFSSEGTASVVGSLDGGLKYQVEGAIRAAWSVGGENQGATSVTRGAMVLVEGETAKWQSGQTVPVPRVSTSPYGVSRVEGYDRVEVGFVLGASSWRTPEGLALRLDPSVSEVIGQVADAPILATRSVSTVVHLRDGDYVLLWGLDDVRSRSSAPALGIGSSTIASDGETVIVLGVRLLR